jgi:endo-1,4-beta-xylanase
MPQWSRRAFLGSSLAAGATFSALAAEPITRASLKDLAHAKGLKFGTAIGTPQLDDARYAEIVRQECDTLVPENELKWYVVRRDSPAFDFSRADRLARFAAASGLALRGHTLLWHHPKWLPQWLNTHDYGANPRAEVERLVTSYINMVCARYPQIQSWDVVNETVDNKTGVMRETIFSKHYGQEVVDLAFHTARAAAPRAQLVYNDYMSWDPTSAAHRDGVLKLLEGFRQRKVPVGALGVQAHISLHGSDATTALAKTQQKEWRHFLDQVVAMNYDLLITEFDVSDRELPADVASRDRAVADYARAYLDLMLSYPRLKTVMVWGLSDRYSWLQKDAPRADKLANRCSPYDDNYRAKPLREAIAAAFRTAPARNG